MPGGGTSQAGPVTQGFRFDTADVLASKAYLDAIAARLRESGLIAGSLDRLSSTAPAQAGAWGLLDRDETREVAAAAAAHPATRWCVTLARTAPPLPTAAPAGPVPTFSTTWNPSRKLAHLVRAHSATCDAPGCPSPAASADLDHTVPVRHEVAHNE